LSLQEKGDDAGPSFAGDSDLLRCRLYENQYPEAEEVVMVNVTEIGEMGAYVTLLEYDNIEVRGGDYLPTLSSRSCFQTYKELNAVAV
jgi:hypothetical protein